MSMSKDQSTAERLVEQATGKIIARQFGTKYPGGGGAPRGPVATIFERHGFTESAGKVRDIDAEKALSAAVTPFRSKAGPRGADRSFKVDQLKLDSADAHGIAFGIYMLKAVEGEKLPKQLPGGARLFTYQDRVYATGPRDGDGPEIPECRALADRIAAEANWLLDNARFSKEVSKAITHAVTEAGAYPFISKGAYVAREDNPATARLVALFDELRSTFYDEAKRRGLRTSHVAIRGGDEQALSDSVLDDFQSRVAALVKSLRGEAGNAKTRASTLETRRAECEAILADLGPVRELCGAFAERLAQQVNDLQTAYNGAANAVDLQLPDWASEAEAAGEDVTEDDGALVNLFVFEPNAPVAPVAAPEPEAVPEPEPAPASEPDPEMDLFNL
jgi:hypothetical protein